MKPHCFYRTSDGFFTGIQISGSARIVAANTPDGCAAIEGDYDHLSQRYDIATKRVVEYRPPAPDDDHEWDDKMQPGRPRWRKRRDVVENEEQRTALLEQIKAKEVAAHRRVREILAPSDPQLAAVEQELDVLRAELRLLPDRAG